MEGLLSTGPSPSSFLSVQLDVTGRLLGWHQDHGLPEGKGHGKKSKQNQIFSSDGFPNRLNHLIMVNVPD